VPLSPEIRGLVWLHWAVPACAAAVVLDAASVATERHADASRVVMLERLISSSV
jgi:hypothetical protein